MTAPMRAAIAYFAIAFAAGFGLGTLRVLVLAPRLGELATVCLEVPVMVAVSCVAALWCLRRFGVATTGDRFFMGFVAFVLLQVAETALAGLLGPAGILTNMHDYLFGTATPARLIGLVGQIVFGVLPLLVGRR